MDWLVASSIDSLAAMRVALYLLLTTGLAGLALAGTDDDIFAITRCVIESCSG